MSQQGSCRRGGHRCGKYHREGHCRGTAVTVAAIAIVRLSPWRLSLAVKSMEVVIVKVIAVEITQ